MICRKCDHAWHALECRRCECATACGNPPIVPRSMAEHLTGKDPE